MEKQTLILDSSQLEDFLTCPRYWKYRNYEDIFPNDQDTRAMDMGTLGHWLLEVYHKSRARGIKIFDAKQAAINSITEPKATEIITKYKITREDVQSVLTTVEDWITRNCMNEFTPLSPNHVEVGFSYPLYEDDQVLFIVEGKIDIMGIYRNLDTVVDHKFHLRVTKIYDHSIQFRNYAMITGYNHVIVNHLVFANGKGKTEDKNFYMDPITFPESERRQWREELISIYFNILDQMEKPVSMHTGWLRRSSCGGKYGKPCEYTTLCNEYDAQLRQRKQEMFYHIRTEKWRPW